jgi:preprotein translocase subunit YajC
MPAAVSSIFLLAQAQPPGGGLFGGFLGPIIPFLVIGMLFYLLLIRPERRKRQEMDKMLDNLNKDDQVVTIGGVWGVVVNTSKGSEYITIRVDEGNGTKLRVLRSAVSRVITGGDTPATKDGT